MKRASSRNFYLDRSLYIKLLAFLQNLWVSKLGSVTVKTENSHLPVEALQAVEATLFTGEEIAWTGFPNGKLYVLDLSYQGCIWWTVFACFIPFVPGDSSLLLITLMVFILTFLEYKKYWMGRAYFITNLRVIYAEKTSKGEWRLTAFERGLFQSAKRSAVMKSLNMKFKTAGGLKALRFPYLSDLGDALTLLQGGKTQSPKTGV